MNKHGVIVTKTPTLAFKTKDGCRCTMTFNKHRPDVIEMMLFEVIKMAYLHYGGDANKLIDSQHHEIEARYQQLELEQLTEIQQEGTNV